MTNKEKYLQRIAGKESDAIIETRQRIKDRAWLIQSQKLALRILIRLDELGWKKSLLAEKLEVTPQYVSKLLKGNEKFGFDILVKLENILSLNIFSDFNAKKHITSSIKKETGKLLFVDFGKQKNDVYKLKGDAKIIKLPTGNDYVSLEDIKEN